MATVRIYADIAQEVHRKGKVVALTRGMTFKGWLERTITDAVKEFYAQEAETAKREKQAAKK